MIADRRVGPAVEWQLRRFPRVTWVERLDQLSPGASTGQAEPPAPETYRLDDFAAILAPAEAPVASDKGYAGQGFAIRANWSPAGLSDQALIRWLMLRTASTPANLEQAVLWVEQPQPVEGQGQEETGGVSQR